MGLQQSRFQGPATFRGYVALGYPSSEISNMMKKGGIREQGVGQPDLECLPGVDRLARQNDVESGRDADTLWQAAAATPGRDDTETDFG